MGSPAARGGIVLGLDPGSRRTGFGIVRTGPDGPERLASGVITLDSTRPFAERLPDLRDRIRELIRAHKPREAVLETCFVARGIRAALVLGHVRGVLLLLCLDAGLDVYEYAPAEIKRSVTGRGTASKEQVQEMLRRLLLHPPERPSQDESDALAIAYCHLIRPPVARADPLQACHD
jgi:crossover junction endodeoxyribonuclease RuvC